MNENKYKKLEVLKVKDTNEKYYTPLPIVSDIPHRILVVGKSQLSGKTNFLVNYLCNPTFGIKGHFKGENIYLVSASVGNDFKLTSMIECLEIDHQNIFKEYDEEVIEALYEMIEDEFEEKVNNKQRPENFLIIFDDMSSSGIFKGGNFSIINKMFSNGRHINLSVMITAQKYTDISNSQRENMTMGVFFNCSDKQLDLITEDINYLTDKKTFKKKFRETTKEKHSFFVVNFTNDFKEMYLDKNFIPIKMLEEDDLKTDKKDISKIEENPKFKFEKI